MNDNNDCLFCKIISGEIPSLKVYEDENNYGFLDIKPVNDGHTLLIPKKHYKNLYEMSDEDLSKISIALRDLSKAIKNAVLADGINIEMNNDKAAGQIIFHAHMHIIPRFIDDGLRHWPGHTQDENKQKEIAKKIINQINK